VQARLVIVGSPIACLTELVATLIAEFVIIILLIDNTVRLLKIRDSKLNLLVHLTYYMQVWILLCLGQVQTLL
jgi:hypothetical protein